MTHVFHSSGYCAIKAGKNPPSVNGVGVIKVKTPNIFLPWTLNHILLIHHHVTHIPFLFI
jgi:hypothetical protein